jgi:peptide/nickel transport system ATP-binding protein
VMYAGRVVEKASARELFERPLHAYTRGLLASIPTLETPSKALLRTIPGMVASLAEHTPGCRFCQRMGRLPSRGTGTRARPSFSEVSPGHWVETCPECYQP